MNARQAATPVALVALAAGAVGYAYVVDRTNVSDADRAARRNDVFPSFRVEEVRRVELQAAGETLALERAKDGGDGWTIASPLQESADPATVDVLLRDMELAARVRDVPPEEASGLEAPRVRGQVTVGSIDYRFALGADAPRPEGGAYMRLENEGTFVVGRSLKVQLLRTADAYRDRTLVPSAPGEVGRVEVRSPAGGFVLERAGTTFRVGDRTGLRAARAAVDREMAALTGMRAESFLDDGLADRATANAEWTVTVVPQDAHRPRVRLLLGGACPGEGTNVVAVRTEPTRRSACVPKSSIEPLDVNAEDLVDKGLLFAHADEIEEIRLEAFGAGVGSVKMPVDIARRATGWHERSPDNRDLDSDQSDSANALAAALAGSQALEARRPLPGESVATRARATIVRSGGGSTEIVELGAPDPAGTPARRLEDGAILRLARPVARRFEAHPVALRAPGLWTEALPSAAVVAVDDSCSPTPQRIELRDNTWMLRAPAGLPADGDSVRNLVDAFAHAKVESWVDEGDDGSFGLQHAGSCAVTLTWALASEGGAPQRSSVVFGAAGEGGVYARPLGGQAVGVASTSLREAASRPAIDRSRFRIDPSKLEHIVLVHGGARLQLTRAGSLLTRDGATDDDAGRGERLESALGAFYAQYALHAGPAADAEGYDRPTLGITTTAHGATPGEPVQTRITVGAPTRVGSLDAYFARVAGVDATFAVPRSAVDAILQAW